MSNKSLKIILSIIIFLLCIFAPGLVGILVLGLIAYIFSDIIVDRLFGDEE